MIKMQIKSIQIKCKDTPPQFSLQQICSILTQPPFEFIWTEQSTSTTGVYTL